MFDDDRASPARDAPPARREGPSNSRIFAGSILFAVVVVGGSIALAWLLFDWMSALF